MIDPTWLTDDVVPRVCAKGDAICIPSNYSKFDLPDESLTTVNVGIDIKDIPKIDDKEFSITLNAFFVVRWTDTRMIIDQVSNLHTFMLQTWPLANKQMLNKPYVNEITLREQNLPLKCCQPLEKLVYVKGVYM